MPQTLIQNFYMLYLELDFFDYFALHCRCVWSDQFTFGAI